MRPVIVAEVANTSVAVNVVAPFLKVYVIVWLPVGAVHSSLAVVSLISDAVTPVGAAGKLITSNGADTGEAP